MIVYDSSVSLVQEMVLPSASLAVGGGERSIIMGKVWPRAAPGDQPLRGVVMCTTSDLALGEGLTVREAIQPEKT